MRVTPSSCNDPDRTHVTRWQLIITPWFGLHLDRIDGPDPRLTRSQPWPYDLQSAPRRRLHNHPRPCVSLVLRGGYDEEVGIRDPEDRTAPIIGRASRTWRSGSVHVRRTTDAHVITRLHRMPTWTLVLAGRRPSDAACWGYWDWDKWTPHCEHAHAAEVGLGNDHSVETLRLCHASGTAGPSERWALVQPEADYTPVTEEATSP